MRPLSRARGVRGRAGPVEAPPRPWLSARGDGRTRRPEPGRRVRARSVSFIQWGRLARPRGGAAGRALSRGSAASRGRAFARAPRCRCCSWSASPGPASAPTRRSAPWRCWPPASAPTAPSARHPAGRRAPSWPSPSAAPARGPWTSLTTCSPTASASGWARGGGGACGPAGLAAASGHLPAAGGRWAGRARGGVWLLLFENCSRNKEGARLGFPGPPPQPLPFLPGCGGAALEPSAREFSPRLVLLSPSASARPGRGVGRSCWERLPRSQALSFAKHCPTCSARNQSKGLSGIRALLPLFIFF